MDAYRLEFQSLQNLKEKDENYLKGGFGFSDLQFFRFQSKDGEFER